MLTDVQSSHGREIERRRGISDLPLGHDRCKARPRLTPEKAQMVSGHYKE